MNERELIWREWVEWREQSGLNARSNWKALNVYAIVLTTTLVLVLSRTATEHEHES